MTSESSLSVGGIVLRKVIALGAFFFFMASRLIYRLSSLGRARLIYIDHITFPCDDLGVAEAFYVGVMGARIVMRIDEPTLLKMGWHPEQIHTYQAVHLSLTLAGGPRLDLFKYPAGRLREETLHPHVAFRVAPSQFLAWKRRLMANGVTISGPTRPGPPGQASFYFNDPFGNHLEIVAMGFVDSELPAGMHDRSHLNYVWNLSED
jgi:catechol 2,3-dioxygenase-like lactoylglutathione lyase family enzyme